MSKLFSVLSSGERVVIVARRFLGGVDAARISLATSDCMVGSVLSKAEESTLMKADIDVLRSLDASVEKIWLAARILRGNREDLVVRFWDEDLDGGTGNGETLTVEAEAKV